MLRKVDKPFADEDALAHSGVDRHRLYPVVRAGDADCAAIQRLDDCPGRELAVGRMEEELRAVEDPHHVVEGRADPELDPVVAVDFLTETRPVAVAGGVLLVAWLALRQVDGPAAADPVEVRLCLREPEERPFQRPRNGGGVDDLDVAR